jgi:hypothetical protein
MIFELWDQLCGFSPCQVDEALTHLFNSLGSLVQADNVFWAATVRMVDGSRAGFDVGHGWRIHAARSWRASSASSVVTSPRTGERENFVHLINPAVTRGSGRFRVHGLHSQDNAPAIVHERACHAPDVQDRLWIAFPINADTESYFILCITRHQMVSPTAAARSRTGRHGTPAHYDRAARRADAAFRTNGKRNRAFARSRFRHDA